MFTKCLSANNYFKQYFIKETSKYLYKFRKLTTYVFMCLYQPLKILFKFKLKISKVSSKLKNARLIFFK